MLAKAPQLKVIGRAGVGVDNVDLDAATAAGVLVMNTPGGNAVSVAEHTLGADARHGALHPAGRSLPPRAATGRDRNFWARELRGKTLGVVGPRQHRPGSGRAGRAAFEMRIIANDPYVNSQTAADLGATLLTLGRICSRRAITSRCTSH